ncbi:hypothetical protein HNR01_001014 [Methylorubrum rhodesianum]|uniref:hypothetical protein n=1 Tax=Methylorubrum rhodesianum TaxID=29427 RepID=UPI00161E3AA2|nr:hypothetical protein [Methylorubrum rhodesianum]MBB5761402.1 hypothetical protein [Methylorubrum rhodesianum]
MTKSNSPYTYHGFKHRLHFLRLEGESALNIGNPIVAFEDGNGSFSPRRPEPGETHPDTRCFNSDAELNDFLFEREVNHVNHSRLLEDEKERGISPYFEFVEDPEARRYIQPGLPSYGGFYEGRAFPLWLDRSVLEYRARALIAAEYKSAIFAGILMAEFRERGPAEIEHGPPAHERIAEHIEMNRKRRWFQPRKQLPPGTPRFYRDAQIYQPWYERDDGRRAPDTGSLSDWA